MPTRSEMEAYGNGVTDTVVGGWHVIIRPDDPVPDGELARRIVRHTFGKEFMDWCGEELGPAPYDSAVYYSVNDGILFVTERVFRKLSMRASAGAPIRTEPLPDSIPQWYRDYYPPQPPEVPDVFSL